MLRGEIGFFLGARTVWLELILSVNVGEENALLTIIEWINEIGSIDNIIFFTHQLSLT